MRATIAAREIATRMEPDLVHTRVSRLIISTHNDEVSAKTHASVHYLGFLPFHCGITFAQFHPGSSLWTSFIPMMRAKIQKCSIHSHARSLTLIP